MKLPSLQQTAQDAGRTFFRFPFVITDALVGTMAALILADHEGSQGPTILMPILFAATLGFPLFISVSLIAERYRWSRSRAIAVQLLGVLLLIGYATAVPWQIEGAPHIYSFRHALLLAALNLFVSIAPFLGSGSLNSFWKYNKAIFLRIFTTVIYAGVLFAGLSLALAALDHLFGMNIPGKRYGELWTLITGILASWFFLAGVPDEWEETGSPIEYPKVLRIFAQYILIPLILVYFVILYAYIGKIIIEWNWPQGI